MICLSSVIWLDYKVTGDGIKSNAVSEKNSMPVFASVDPKSFD